MGCSIYCGFRSNKVTLRDGISIGCGVFYYADRIYGVARITQGIGAQTGPGAPVPTLIWLTWEIKIRPSMSSFSIPIRDPLSGTPRGQLPNDPNMTSGRVIGSAATRARRASPLGKKNGRQMPLGPSR